MTRDEIVEAVVHIRATVDKIEEKMRCRAHGEKLAGLEASGKTSQWMLGLGLSLVAVVVTLVQCGKV